MRSDTVKRLRESSTSSFVKVTGVKEEDFDKPFVAIVNSFVDIVPGHVHLQEYGRLIKDAVAQRRRAV
jgi:dihydroxy-acid dehydratase